LIESALTMAGWRRYRNDSLISAILVVFIGQHDVSCGSATTETQEDEMQHWVKLTEVTSGGDYYVNLEQVTDMWREGDATKICFLGTGDDPASVVQAPDQILAMPAMQPPPRPGY
jgi:hypothetical protein